MIARHYDQMIKLKVKKQCNAITCVRV